MSAKFDPILILINIKCYRAGQTVLHIAAERGDEAMLRYILQRPGLSDVDPKDLLGGQVYIWDCL